MRGGIYAIRCMEIMNLDEVRNKNKNKYKNKNENKNKIEGEVFHQNK